MDQELKQRLIGAAVVIALAIIFVPMVFDGDGAGQKNQKISITIPDQPEELEFKQFKIDEPVSQQSPPIADVGLSQDIKVQDGQIVAKPILQTVDTEISKPESKDKTLIEPEVIDSEQSQPLVKNSEQTDVEPQPQENIESQAQIDQPEVSVQVGGVDLAYRVKLGSFSKKANAHRVKTQLMQKKIQSVVEKDSERDLFHVWSADLYQNKSSAEDYVKAVNELGLNIGQPSIDTMNAEQVDRLAEQGQLGWVVQLGVFGAKANAMELKNKVSAAGFQSFIDRLQNSQGKDLFRLRVGPLMEKQDALDAQLSLKNSLQIDGLVKTHEPGLPIES